MNAVAVDFTQVIEARLQIFKTKTFYPLEIAQGTFSYNVRKPKSDIKLNAVDLGEYD
jgi:hypothetical protein